MHLLRITMSSQSHVWLRLGALALLVTAALWPRGSRGAHADAMTSAEVARGPEARVEVETVSARLVSSPRTTKLVVADADESQLKN